MFSFISGIQRSCLDPKAVVVLLHGYGGCGSNFRELLSDFDLPDVHFWCPDGLEECLEYPPGRQWFSFEGAFWQVNPSTPDHTLPALKDSWEIFYPRLDQAANAVKQRIEEGLNGFEGPVILGGFSQGCAMAIHLGLTKLRVTGVVGFSGMYFVTHPPVFSPPILWCHGDHDTTVSLDWMRQAQADFRAKNIHCDGYVLKDLGHEVSQQGIQLAREFIIHQVQKKHDNQQGLMQLAREFIIRRVQKKHGNQEGLMTERTP